MTPNSARAMKTACARFADVLKLGQSKIADTPKFDDAVVKIRLALIDAMERSHRKGMGHHVGLEPFAGLPYTVMA